MATHTTNYNLSKPEASDAFSAFRQSYNDNMDIIDQNLDGGGGGGDVVDVEVNGVSVLDPVTKIAEITSYEEVTEAQYEAIPIAERETNGIAYFIKDLNNESVEGYPPLIYSDEEREVGVWRDGKPLYQKTFIQTLNNIASGTETNMTDVSGLNIDELADITGRVNYFNGTIWFNVNLGTYFGAYVHTNGYLTFLQTMTGQTTNRSYIVAVTLRYTKTTDTPGSGIWNGQGGIAHHYSTNETVIGTWVDGKPLYEKTINFGSIPSSSTKEVDHNISNLKMTVGFEGMMMNTDGVTFETLPSGENSNFRIQINATKIKIITSASWAAWTNSYITLKYTKTTD